MGTMDRSSYNEGPQSIRWIKERRVKISIKVPEGHNDLIGNIP